MSADTPTASSLASTIPTAASGAAASSIGDDVGGRVDGRFGVVGRRHLDVRHHDLFGAVALISFGWPEGPLYELTQRFTLKSGCCPRRYVPHRSVDIVIDRHVVHRVLQPFSFADTFTRVGPVPQPLSGWSRSSPAGGWPPTGGGPRRRVPTTCDCGPTVAVVTLAFGRVSSNLALIGLIVMILVMAVRFGWAV